MPPSTVVRRVRADEDLPGAMTPFGPDGRPSGALPPRGLDDDPAAAASQQVAAARDRKSACSTRGHRVPMIVAAFSSSFLPAAPCVLFGVQF